MEGEVDHRPRAIERSRMTANVEEARKLMQVEKMNTGGMKAAVYTGYLGAGKGMIMVPLLVLSVIVAQAFTLLTSFWLVWWQERKFDRSDSFYEGVYSALGVGSAVFLFAMGATQGILSYFASVTLYRRATLRLLKAPMSFYDTNPLGRILNRMSKDRYVVRRVCCCRTNIEDGHGWHFPFSATHSITPFPTLSACSSPPSRTSSERSSLLESSNLTSLSSSSASPSSTSNSLSFIERVLYPSSESMLCFDHPSTPTSASLCLVSRLYGVTARQSGLLKRTAVSCQLKTGPTIQLSLTSDGLV